MVLMHVLLLLLLLSLSHTLGGSTASADDETVEPRTGISFLHQVPGLGGRRRNKYLLNKLGVRTKGPFKVYAVGQYGDDAFLLQMSMNVKAQRISDALMDALKWRCKEENNLLQEPCGETDMADFRNLLMSGLPEGGASKGTRLLFETSRGKLAVTINEESIGSLSSKPLAAAFRGIYTDDKAVCRMNAVTIGDDVDRAAAVDTDEDAEGEEEEQKQHEKMESIVLSVSAIAVTTFLLWVYDKTRLGRGAVTVRELNVYPIKSCAPQPVQRVVATARGFRGDRLIQVTDKNSKYCTPRDVDKARLFLVTPTLSSSSSLTSGSRNREAAVAEQNILTVTAPNMPVPLQLDLSIAPTKRVMVEVLEAPAKLPLQDYGSEAAKWMEQATEIQGCRLTGVGDDFDRIVRVNEAQGDPIPTSTDGTATTAPAPPVSLADEAPYLLCSTSSLQDLNQRLTERGKTAVDMRRFRPNLVLGGLKPWEEDCWSKIRIGGKVEFWVWQRCGRCTMTTIDRDTLERGPEPLATLNTFRERQNGMRNFGMHLIPDPSTLPAAADAADAAASALISVGDYVEVLEYDNERRSEWERLFG